MSHYLQRLAASVQQPTGNVHPILDPVFATARPRAGALLEEDNAVVGNIGSQQTACPATAGDFSSPGTADSPQKIGDPQPDVSNDEQPAPFMPPLPATVRATQAVTDARLRPSGLPSHPPQLRPHVVSPTNDARTADDYKPREGVVGDQPLQPSGEFQGRLDDLEIVESPAFLAPAPLVPETVCNRLPKSAAFSVTGPRSSEPFGLDRSQRSRKETSKPDEIQIHIGRIEVTAVQAGPPSPVVQRPQRWSPSLQEYLRRHDSKGA